MVNIWPLFAHSIGAGCPLCRAPADGLCARCIDSLPRNDHGCACCAVPLPAQAPAGTLCVDCQRRAPSVDRVVAPLRYEFPVDDLVAGFKYHRRLALGRPLATLLADKLQQRGSAMPDLLLPVPMHRLGLRGRGFNQAAELTRLLARRLAIPWSASRLLRIRHAEHQRGLTRAQRQRNLRDSFRCRGRLPHHVALVDDVVTTGATMNEIGHTLRGAGAKRIEVWAVARTPRD